jgi:hypothetical protein
MNKRTKARAGRVRKPAGSTRVVRISQEAWAAKCAVVARQGRPVEIAAYFDRALRLDSRAKAS